MVVVETRYCPNFSSDFNGLSYCSLLVVDFWGFVIHSQLLYNKLGSHGSVLIITFSKEGHELHAKSESHVSGTSLYQGYIIATYIHIIFDLPYGLY